MFRRKYDFKPDKTGSGILNKLYPTRRQRQSFLRWLLLTLCLVALSLMQDVIFCRFTALGATTDLVSAGILLLCMMLDTDTSAVFALISSTLFFFSGSAPGAYTICYLTGLGAVLNIFRRSYLRRSFGSTVFCAALGLMAYEGLVFLTVLFLDRTTLARAGAFMLSGGLSVIAMPLLYPIFSAINKIGGDTWKE